jgi:hypothetical protein
MELMETGTPVVDASLPSDNPDKNFNVRGKLLMVIADYPAKSKLTCQIGAGVLVCFGLFICRV